MWHIRFLFLIAILAPSLGNALTANHLIISEIQTLNNDVVPRPLCSEFIEIVNPTGSAIDLSEVYLSDAIYAPGNQFYYRIAEGDPSGATVGGGAFNDFHARFPAGYSIAPGDTVVISIGGSTGFENAYGWLPDFELFEDGAVPDQVPELLEVFPGSIAAGLAGGDNNPSLTDSSESVVLYTWDGINDLVQDLDFAFWGTSTTILFDKTGVTIGSGTYQADTPVSSQDRISSLALFFGQSYMRHSADEGTEIDMGGNGISGHDETSENLGTTWEVAAAANPGMQPGSFFPSAPIFTDHLWFPTEPCESQPVTLSVTALSWSPQVRVTFFVCYDDGPFSPISGANISGDTFVGVLPGQLEGTSVRWYAEASNVAGAIAVWPFGGECNAAEWVVAPDPQPVQYPDKLLFSEICTVSTELEFVEIFNPNAFNVDMSDYYLTDAIWTPINQVYWRIAEGNPGPETVGGGAFGDFHARFPAGFSIAAGDTIVIACSGSIGFEGGYGFLPDLELFEDDPAPDDVPDMLPVWVDGPNNSIVSEESIPTLTNGGESLVLYFWENGADLVTDIDIFLWKDPSYISTSFLFCKTGVTVGDSTYKPDTLIGFQLPYPVQLTFGYSYQRTDFTEGDQLASGSNGVDGRDETSEDFNATFSVLPPDPAGREPTARDLIVSMRPREPVIVIPDTGGVFHYDVSIENTTNSDVTASVGIQAVLPNGSLYAVLFLANRNFQAGSTIVRTNLIQEVPAGAPAGPYVYRLSVGTAWDDIIDWDEFPFEKLATGLGFDQEADWVLKGWDVSPAKPLIPASGFTLHAPAPNPFNPQTTIAFELPEQGAVTLRVFDLHGRLVRVLVDGEVYTLGRHEAVWNGRDDAGRQAASGTYFYRLEAGGYSETKRMVLIK